MSYRYRAGQGLLEMVIAIGIITVSLLTTLGLVFVTLQTAEVSKHQILARNLAREAVEVVRALRDTNWLNFDAGVAGVAWNDGLEGLAFDYSAVPSFEPSTGVWTLLFGPAEADLRTDQTVISFNVANGIYSQFIPGSVPGGFVSSNFWRILRLNPICWQHVLDRLEPATEVQAPEGNDCVGAYGADFSQVGIAVHSTVRWLERTQTHDIGLVENLYNWKP